VLSLSDRGGEGVPRVLSAWVMIHRRRPRTLPVLHLPRRRLGATDAILAAFLQDARRRLVEVLRRVPGRQRLGFPLVGHRRQIALAGRRRLVDRRRLIALVALHGRLARLSLRAARRGVGAGLRPRVLLLAAWRLIVGAARLLAVLVALRRL